MWSFCGHFVIQVTDNSVGKQETIIFVQIHASGSEEGQMAGLVNFRTS